MAIAKRKTPSGRGTSKNGASAVGETGHPGKEAPPQRRPHPGAPPADPWPVDDFPEPPEDCECEPPRPPSKPRPPREPARPKDDCCERILEALRCIPGIDEKCLKLHKPKTTPKFKIANTCGELPVKDRLAPMMLLVLRRFRDGVAPGNAFETRLQAFLGGLPAKQLAALEAAQDGYDALPAPRRDCVFDTRFAAWPDEKPLDPDFFARNLVGEILALGRFWKFGGKPGPPPPPTPAIGQARPWEQTLMVPGEPGRTTKIIAPWPWICAVSPIGEKGVTTETGWVRNESQFVPGNLPRGSVNYFAHEFTWRCTSAATGLKCEQETPSAGSGGGFGFAMCPGGLDYLVFDKAVSKQVCLAIPQFDVGTEIGLRGLNFFSSRAKVHIRKVDGPPFRPIPPVPLSDWLPDDVPATAPTTCGGVRDHAWFVMPATVRDGLSDIPIPPGRYALTLVVPNDVSFAVAGGGPPPAEFASNEVLFDLLPNPTKKYQVLVDQAFCDEETSGPGSDEPWFFAWAATAEVPKAGTTVPFSTPQQIEIIKAKDVDTGEAITFSPASLFAGELGRRILGIGVLGLEVDSESAAKEQIESFGAAFAAYWKEFYASLVAGAASGVLGAAIEKAVASGAALGPVGWVAGAVLVLIIAIGLFYAAWAPADPIALDFLAYGSRQLFDMTDANVHVLPEWEWNRVRELRMKSEPLQGARCGRPFLDLLGETSLPQHLGGQPLQPGLSVQAHLKHRRPAHARNAVCDTVSCFEVEWFLSASTQGLPTRR